MDNVNTNAYYVILLDYGNEIELICDTSSMIVDGSALIMADKKLWRDFDIDRVKCYIGPISQGDYDKIFAMIKELQKHLSVSGEGMHAIPFSCTCDEYSVYFNVAPGIISAVMAINNYYSCENIVFSLNTLINLYLYLLGDKKLTSDIVAAYPRSLVKLRTTLRYISKNYRDPDLNASTVIYRSGMGRTVLSNLFKTCMHMGIYEYVTNYRLFSSLNDLLTTYDLLETIAVENGFYCYNSFLNCFKKSFNMCPSDYRDYMRKTVLSLNTKRNMELDSAA